MIQIKLMNTHNTNYDVRPSGKTKDGIAVTTAGNLPSKCIIHMATPQAYDRKGPASKEWQDRIIRCLQEAENMKMKSIAFPLLGTGKSRLIAVCPSVEDTI